MAKQEGVPGSSVDAAAMTKHVSWSRGRLHFLLHRPRRQLTPTTICINASGIMSETFPPPQEMQPGLSPGLRDFIAGASIAIHMR